MSAPNRYVVLRAPDGNNESGWRMQLDGAVEFDTASRTARVGAECEPGVRFYIAELKIVSHSNGVKTEGVRTLEVG